MKRFTLRAPVVGAVLALVATACASGSPDATQPAPEDGSPGAMASEPGNDELSGKILVVSGTTRDNTEAAVNSFMEQHPGVEVEFIAGPIEQTLTKIELEVASTGRILADVLWIGDIATLESFEERDLLEPFDASVASEVPDELKDPENHWASSFALNMYPMYNTNSLSTADAPTGWEDLADPKYKGKIALPDPSVSGTGLTLVFALAQTYGWEFWERVAANEPVVNPSTASLLEGVVSGEFPIVPMVDFLARPTIAEGSPVKVVKPSDGVVGTHILAAKVSQSDNSDIADALVRHLLSKEVADILTGQGVTATHQDSAVENDVPELTEPQLMTFDWVAFGEQREEVKERFRQIMER